MPRVKKVKQKKITVAELKRLLVEGAELLMVEFHGSVVSKKRKIASVHSTFCKLTGDGIPEGDYSYLTWPKASELSATDTGFAITNKNGRIAYSFLIQETLQNEED